MRAFLVIMALCATPALADVVIPERDACRGKAIGDACDGGTCASAGFSCEAGSCRRHGDQEACRKDGCDWRELVECLPSSAKTAPPLAPTTPQQAGAASCAAAGTSVGAWAFVGVRALARRRQTVSCVR